MRIGGKKITVIASDFDGTIIRQGMSAPSEQFYELINECLEQDIFFVAASGRQYSNLYRLLHGLKKEIAYISENGSLLTYKGQVLHKAVIEETLAEELLEDILKEEGCDIMVSGQDTSYVLDRNPDFAQAVEKSIGNNCCVLKSFGDMPEEKIKISMYYPSGIPRDVTEKYHEKYDARLQVVDAGNDWFDFNPKESSKGYALQVLARKLGLKLEETAAFGDGENDISMLKAAAVSFAMDSAKPNVKASVRYLCSNVEDVLSYGLNQEKELESYALALAGSAGKTPEEGRAFRQTLLKDEELLEEFEYFYINRNFLCKHKVAGYTVTDVLVWQVDHFKAYMDRYDAVNRYDRDRLVFSAFDVLLKMRDNPKFYADKLEGETGTDFENKYN